MLGDGKLDSLDTRLEQFKLNNQSNQNELQTIMREYSQLLEDYKTLKTAFESKGTVVKKEAPKPEPAEKARRPYVLVLIDGNGYVFNDELVREKEEGGMRAARMLNEVVEKYIRESLPQLRDAPIVVRLYADLTNLSKQLAKYKLVGLEKRSLAPFAAAFTRAINLFDFTDALDEEGTKFKIRESFKLAAEDSACSHILYAACHDRSYLSQLVPYSGLRDKITLVQGGEFNSEFHQFSLSVTQFPTLFRWGGLSSITPTKPTTANLADRSATPLKSPQKTKTVQKPTQTQSALRNGDSWRNNPYNADTAFGADDMSSLGESNGFTDSNGSAWNQVPESKQKSQSLCKYFSKGFCRFGDKCNFQHVSNGIVMSNHQANGNSPDRSNISSYLPTSKVPGFIPLNKDGQRIDLFVRPPTQKEWDIYNERFRRQKPCNSHHLQGVCTQFNCGYDHSELEPESRHCLEYVLKSNPCPRRGACRASDCFYGHICQKDNCMGQFKGCKLKADMHNTDPKLASMVPAEEELVEHDDFAAMPSERSAMW